MPGLFLLFLIALGMNWLQPLLGVLFVGVGVVCWRLIRRELSPLHDAFADYPQLAARFGRRRVPPLFVGLATPAYLLLLFSAAGWVGWSTYEWGRTVIEPMLIAVAPAANSAAPPSNEAPREGEAETSGEDPASVEGPGTAELKKA